MSAFCPICNQLSEWELSTHIKELHKKGELAQWIAHYGTAPGELADLHEAYKALRDERDALLRGLRVAQKDLEGAQTQRNEAERDRLAALQDLGASRRAHEITQETLDLTRAQWQAAQTEAEIERQAYNALAKQVDALHSENLGAKRELEAAYTITQAANARANQLLQLLGGIADQLAEFAGRGAPVDKPSAPGQLEAAGIDLTPIPAVQIPSPAFDLLNNLAWFASNTLQFGGDNGFQHGMLLEHGPAHKLLLALEAYIHATRPDMFESVEQADQTYAWLDQDMEDDNVPF